jgi:ketosteroid isomerase-like protein
MPMSAEATIHDYFQSWKTHDLDLLTRIFTPDADYIVSPRNTVYRGIHEIERYWRRNAKRQSDLIISYTILSNTEHEVQCFFETLLHDTEEHQKQKITGNIRFLLDAQACITQLSETYDKTVLNQV